MATKKEAETVRLTSPSGVTVSVAADKAERLAVQGYTKPTARRSKSSSADDK